MSSNPINLGLRFLLELAGLAAMAYWGWTQHEALAQILWCVGLPLIAAAFWGIFRTSVDPQKPPVEIPGPLRLVFEAIYFGGAVLLLNAAQQPTLALILGVIIVLHYALSYDRVRSMLSAW